jgi:hypothetical protein
LIEKAYFMRQQIEGNQKSQVSYKVGGVWGMLSHFSCFSDLPDNSS